MGEDGAAAVAVTDLTVGDRTDEALAGRATIARNRPWRLMLAVWGPGLIVMLADTDAGCLITAAQSGAQFGYSLIAAQVLLIPILYAAQEITIRLGVVTGKGHGALIRERFGVKWAAVSSATLLLSAVGALLTEFAGIAGVGELFGISKWVTIPIATIFLVGLACGESYKRVERVGIAIGLAELTFVGAMILAHPSGHDLLHGLVSQPIHNHDYTKLLAANIGAVVMPWMIFYQQGAVIDRGLKVSDLKAERRDTLFGSFLTQAIMIVVIVALAATAYKTDRGAALNTVPQISDLLGRTMGSGTARALVGAAILGGALVAALVVSLAGAWGMAEVMGWKHTLNERPSGQNSRFYVTYTLTHVVGAILVLASVDLVSLAVDVEVMNALLLPIVLGFLLLLEAKALPGEHRMRGPYRWVVTGACCAVMTFGLYMVPASIRL